MGADPSKSSHIKIAKRDREKELFIKSDAVITHQQEQTTIKKMLQEKIVKIPKYVFYILLLMAIIVFLLTM